MSSARNHPTLLSAFELGCLRLRNRCVIPGHSMRLSRSDGIGPRLHAYLLERARGGAALVGIESSPVSPDSQVDLSPLPLFSDGLLPSLTALTRDLHAAGAHVSIILWHGGHNIPHFNGSAPLSASAVPSPVTGVVPRAASVEEIAGLIAAYAAAARRCVESGIDVLEVQTASDYLLGSFLSPRLNLRTDHYGGSLENRLRIVVEVLQAVRAAAGRNVVVGVRTSVAHLIPGDPADYGADQSLEAMRLLDHQGLLDYVSLLEGSHWRMEAIIPPMGAPPAPLEEVSRHFRRELSVPVILSGRVRGAAQAERLLASGCADLIGMVRPWIAEPHWVAKVARGEEARVRPCMSCNQGCLGHVARGLPGTCVINAYAGREQEGPILRNAAGARRIAVIGAGPAGLEAARIAAERGLRVTLYEATAQVGGQMRLAAQVPGRAEMRAPIDWWVRELQALGVEVRVDSPIATPAEVDADVVVWANGAASGYPAVWRRRPWLHQGIPGAQRCAHAREVLEGARTVEGNVLIVDEEGGWPALSIAFHLQASVAVSAVTVVSSEVRFGETDTVFTMELPATRARLLEGGVRLYEGMLVLRVDGANAVLADGSALGPFDHIVLSTGAHSRQRPPGVPAIGDCVSPRGIWSAVEDARRIATAL